MGGDAPQVNLYDLLDALIQRVPWRTEAEANQYRKLIEQLRAINLFGYMAYKATVDAEWLAYRQGSNRYQALPPREETR